MKFYLVRCLFFLLLGVVTSYAFAKTNLVTFYGTDKGKEELLRNVIGESQEFVSKIEKLSETIEQSIDLRFGAKDQDKCMRFINDYNHGRNNVKAKDLWGPCVGLPDGLFDDKKIYPSVISSIFGDWTHSTANSYVPRPLVAELSKIKLGEMDFFDPVIKCQNDECFVSIAIKKMSVKASIVVREMLFPDSVVLEIPDLHIAFGESPDDGYRGRAGAKIQMKFKLNTKNRDQVPMVEINEKEGGLIIPRGSIRVDFQGSDCNFLTLLKRSGAITAKDSTIKTLAGLAKSFLNLGPISNLMNLDSTINQFLYEEKNIEIINNLLFPYIKGLVSKALLSSEFIRGEGKEFKIGGDIFRFSFKFYKTKLTQLKMAHEGAISLDDSKEGNELSFIRNDLRKKNEYGYSFNLGKINELLMKIYDGKLLKFEKELEENRIKGEVTEPIQLMADEHTGLLKIMIRAQYEVNGQLYGLSREIQLMINQGETIKYKWITHEGEGVYQKEIMTIINERLMTFMPGSEQILKFLIKKSSGEENSEFKELEILKVKDLFMTPERLEIFF